MKKFEINTNSFLVQIYVQNSKLIIVLSINSNYSYCDHKNTFSNKLGHGKSSGLSTNYC